MKRWKSLMLAVAGLVGSSLPAQAQLSVDVTGEIKSDMRIAVPALPTPANVPTPAGSTADLGGRIAQVIADDLRGSGLFQPSGPGGLPAVSPAEVNAPNYALWGEYQALMQGLVTAQGDGSQITVGCYLYDVGARTEQTRREITVPIRDWRRAAHKCADAVYGRMTGESPFFDSKIAYIAESGPKGARVKRLAIMDSDGANHQFLTNGQAIALTPRYSPDYRSIAYVSYLGKRVRIFVYDMTTNRQRLVAESSNTTFAPRWSPDGQTLLFSMSVSGNTDIYKVSASGGMPIRLTTTPGIDVGGSFSPDGRRIVFESDRSGTQQLYVMNADGSDQQRISRGGGRYATPEWSPRGDLIAFTKIAGDFRIAVMTPGGDGERMLTNGWQDEAPTWSPNGRVLQFFRTSPGKEGVSQVWQVDLTGVNERRIPIPSSGSDPAWGPLLP